MSPEMFLSCENHPPCGPEQKIKIEKHCFDTEGFRNGKASDVFDLLEGLFQSENKLDLLSTLLRITQGENCKGFYEGSCNRN